ncbi:nucleoside/nucleotide kinase family protein [[Clostridium] fimetarium]|uniref:Guanylate kinase n=1 Tax=[Clostridium] fimetarium TaxID=99656 RepID=A0A1I0RW05_9FIRM|nr:guanylate kinase [[Clostridium] fimetarium]SEW45644.1 Guanylate kinase [[Clostridium] fimetarium]
MHEIVFIMGKSSSGKDKIFKKLIADEELKLNTIVMYTTRPMRQGESDGAEYYFVSDDTAAKMEAEGRIIEIRAYHTVHGIWKYFTLDDGQIDINKGKYIVIGTLEAYEKFCDHYGKEHLMPIYIDVDDGIRLTRALAREKKQEHPKYAEMCRRFLADSIDFSEENISKLGIKIRYFNNELLDGCIDQIKKDIIEKLAR